MQFPEKPKAWLTAPPVTLMLTAAAVFLAGINQGDLRLDGAIYAWLAKRMALTGEWLTPYFDWGDTPYFNKPPLMFWIAAFFCRVFGAGDIAVRLPSALFGLACVAMSYRIARRILPPAGAALAGIALVTSYTFKRNTSGFRLDTGVTLCFLLVVEAGFRLLQEKPSQIRQGCAGLWPWILIGLAVGAGLMIKGGVMLLALPILVAGFALARRTDLLMNARWLITLAVAAVVALPWHLYMYAQWGDAFTSIYFGQQVVSRLEGELHRLDPWYYYLRVLGAYYWPWLPFALAGLVLFVRSPLRRTPEGALFVAWLAVYSLAIHVVPSKFDRYLMPLFPLLGIFAADALRRTAAGAWWETRVQPWLGCFAVIVAVSLTAVRAPLSMISVPELHAAVPVMDAALRSSADPDRPRVFAHRGLTPRMVCNILFYSQELDARRFRHMTSETWHPLPHDAFLIVAAADADAVREAYGRAQLISAGRTMAFFQMKPDAVAGSE